ncbi:MAG TPA: TolC family protein [Gemmatimonadaceae bacterium]
MNARRAASIVACAVPLVVHAQGPADSLRLGNVRTLATANDPRTAQLELLASQSALRLRNINAEMLPALAIDGVAQYQSDVARIDVNLPGLNLPAPKKDTYDAYAAVQQRIYDPSLRSRHSVERAQLAESQARVRTAIYSLNESANSAFFIALRAQSQIAELETTVTDLEAQLQVASSRVKAGTALASESNALQAEILRRRQSVAQQRAARKAALEVLSDVTGQAIDTSIALATPDLGAAAIAARERAAMLRQRPEYEQFARTRDVLAATARAHSAEEMPRLSAFGRLGYGRPGLNPLSNKFDTYWLAGVQLQWTPWSWGTSNRNRQLARLQQQIVSTEEEAFTRQVQRSIEQDFANIERLESALSEDEQIITLRESILREARSRFRESVITSAEFIDRQTDVLSARLTRAAHRAELSEARAHLLTTLGMEVR